MTAQLQVPADTTLPMRLYMARKRPNHSVLSQRQAALAIGVSYTTWQNWELGRSEPRASQIRAIARVLDVDETWLLTGRRPIQPGPHGGGTQPTVAKARPARAAMRPVASTASVTRLVIPAPRSPRVPQVRAA